ncbi:RNase P modulator RnpM [Bacillus testis]|uniref:RNase P modulator RnpM n=1 Tax=Bacillus testis TaxID=1622072 RepID=UPI00067F54EF|nr:YlxR family protein [Bacillus testis]
MSTRKKIPMRKCVVTGEMKPKKEMVRIVRSKEGDVSIDLTGKKSGRGAYVSLDKAAILAAQKKDSLARHLEVPIESSLYADLIDLAEKEKQ